MSVLLNEIKLIMPKETLVSLRYDVTPYLSSELKKTLILMYSRIFLHYRTFFRSPLVSFSSSSSCSA